MKKRRSIKTRLCSMMLTACIMFSLLPMSVITFAEGADPVSVTWMPQKQTDSGERQVMLTAGLTQGEEGFAAAMIDIYLDPDEAGALQWDEDSVAESALGAQEPEVTPPDASDSSQTQPDKIEPDLTEPGQAEETEEPETVAQVMAYTAGQNAILINRENDGGAVLRILLIGDETYTDTLTFSTVSNDTAIDVVRGDINVQTYDAEDAPADITAVGLLTSGNGNASISTSAFTVFAHIPEEISVITSTETVDLDGEDSKDIPYNISLQKIASDKNGKEYTFTVELPKGLSLPEGELSYNNGLIQCGGTEIAKLEYLDATVSFSVDALSSTTANNGFSFMVTAPYDENATEADMYSITLTLHADKLVRSAEAISGEMTLTVSEAGGKTASDSATITAGDATLPGEGGWTVNVTKRKNQDQNVYWRDNENTTIRPEGWDDRSFWAKEVKIYYTLTDQKGVTYQRTLLTDDTLKFVGLDAYPTFHQYGTHGFTLENLPAEIQQTDPNDSDSVLNTYTVSWSLEPPDSVDGYSFRDIKANQVGAGHEYPSISNPGWYYMQVDTFTFNLDIRQGNEDPLEDDRENKLRALLSSFQFNWTYTGGSGSDGIIDMIQAFHATPSYHDGKVTITGMWKYNVDGSPINYSVTEITDDSGDTSPAADGKITADELGSVMGLLEENEWYQIQYVNTGVPGEGQDTTALHSGGTLQLVRQGNIQYQATKIWLDSYGDEPNSGRPDASFILYRYRKGEDPGTAAQLTGYSVQLIKKTDQEGNSTGGYAVQVTTGSDADATPADLPKYDTLDGAEFIYVVRETLSGTNAGQYEQVFGAVTVDEATGEIQKAEESLPEGALPGTSTERPSGNTYLYNGGTLTNYQTGTIPVSAAKTWSAAAYQSQFDNVAVELTLQYQVKDSGNWQTYRTDSGETVQRYLHRFYAESLSDTLTARPSMPRYQTTTLDASNKELEYRWLETSVYTDAPNSTETDLGSDTPAENRTDRINIVYNGTETSDAPVGSFMMNGSSYTVTYTGSTPNSTRITNAVSEYLNYEVIKEWRTGSTSGPITLQILRSVAGGEFESYLEFTMDVNEGAETVTVNQTLPENSTPPDDASENFKIEGKAAVKDTDDSSALEETWKALVSGLPRFDERGRPYEYLLLEANAFPSYKTEILDNGDYQTTVINGGGGDGFNLLARKVWLDDGDMEHRAPVTLTLYNKNNNMPVTVSETDATPYTITLGGKSEENLWHKVVWIGTTGLGNVVTDDGDTKFDADDVYLVETQVGESVVDHHLEENSFLYSYNYLYRERNEGEPIFEVTTDNHRYQVTYDVPEEGEDPVADGVEAAFTITNRRLGNIDLTVTKDWVDGRDGDSSQVLNQIKNVLEKYAQDSNDPTYLALAFRLVFDDSMGKTETGIDGDGWEITYSGPSVHSDTVSVGGEDAQIYSTYQKEDQKEVGYKDPGSSEWIILGYVKNADGQWEIRTSDSARFLGLPKYDTVGEVVAYSVEEVWLDVTDADATTAPEVVDFSQSETQKQYSELYELWKDFSANYQWDEYKPDVDGSHTRDEQSLEVTNARRGSKTVQWTVEWQDAFASNSNLRPDIYLDIYQVTYTYDDEGHATPVISRVTDCTIVWDMEDPKEWTATLSGVPAFDEKGNEIFYYAVQRTVMAAGDYDYQAALYESEDNMPLGTRDAPKKDAGIEILDHQKTSITDSYGRPYDLAVLGKRDGDNEDTVDSIQWGSGQPTGIGLFGTSSNYPKYALLEGGTIINTLAESYTIEGVKYWTNLPTGWETETRLPQVTFKVFREIPGETDSKEHVASVTITSDLWEELKNGTQYRYLIQYEGINVLGKNADGEIYVKEVCNLVTNEKVENPIPLSRYRVGTGDLWTYEVEETVDWGTNAPDNGQQIFDDASSSTGFTFTNNYNPTQGSVQVKKFLYLPMTTDEEGDSVPESYPAVTFRLERWLQNEDGSDYTKDGWYQDITLTSDQVESIWNNTTGTSVAGENLVDSGKSASGDAYIWATLKFDDLPIYAPDGTRYQYSVSERKSWLKGYDTWGVKGDVADSNSDVWGQAQETTGDYTKAIKGLEPTVNDTTVDATFKNQRTDLQEEFERLTATKIWEDNDSAFRPGTEEFAKLLTLTRTASKQGGTGGADAITQELTQVEDYTISIVPADGKESTWTITITPADGKSFEKYAPNGMPWTYTLKEQVYGGRLQITQEGGTEQDKIYTPSTPNNKTNGVWQNTITSTTQPVSGSDPKTYSFGSLTNSIMTLAKFEKKWVDAENNPITQDYLGFDLTVEFQLQVRKMGSTEAWVNAGEWKYDEDQTLGLAEGADVNSLTGRVVGATHNWTYTFDDLPGVVQDANGSYIFLEYRVIETKVSWANGEQTISWNVQTDHYNDPVNGPITNAVFSRSNNTSTTTNKLATTSVSVTKVWDDNDNQYGTRPGTDGPWSWASWFVLQRSTDNTNWENVALFQKLYGNNAESENDTEPTASGSWEAVITGLPTMDYQKNMPYTYRVRELQPKADGYTLDDVNHENIVEPGGTYNPDGFNYTTSYNKPSTADNLWTVTNSMDTPTGEVPKNVVAIKDWVGADKNGTVSSVTFQLEYGYSNANGETIWGPADFLPGSQWKKTANAGNSWTVRWDALPETDEAGNLVTGYRVAEEEGSGWVQIGKPIITHDDAAGTTTYSYTFSNSITTSYSVEKVWQPGSLSGHEVTLGLYRTTDTTVGSTSGTPVPADELDGTKGVRTVTLDGTVDADGPEQEAWKATFTNLPKYNASGQEYHYYALELDGSGNPIAQNGKITLNATDYEVSYGWATDDTKTTVTNTTAICLTGTKTWKDNGNAYNTRPDSLTLILERKVGTGNWDDVSDLYTPTWVKNGDIWTYTFTGLPSCDKGGNDYTYQVRESVPNGYTQQSGASNRFTNVLSGTVTILGQKIWSGGVGETEPTLTLERRLYNQTPEASWSVVSATPTWSEPEGSSTWTFTYNGLDKYNTDGVLYEYRVRETPVPDDFEVDYKTVTVEATITGHPATSVDGLIITNYKDGGLTVSKTVSGNRGDQTKDFTFTVTLTGASLAGTAAGNVSGSFATNRTNADGSTVSSSITFANGVSAEFTLKHNESLTIQGLPAGIGYQVTEAEADQDGYSTTGTSWTGSIPAGVTVEAKFNNYSHNSGGGGDSGRTDLTGQKIWVDKGQNDPGRPNDITLELYRKIAGGEEERVYAQPTWVKNGNTWSYTFHNLPKEDENGNKYIYRVSEVVPDGYTSTQSGNNITNRSSEVEPGSLMVSKQVTGSGGNPTQEFTFTVTLSNQNLTGTYGQMTFVNGVATFTLRDGESLLADNLPAGTTYTVVEKEANQDGYTTTVMGGEGTIAADITASASFVNNRPGSNPSPDPDPDPNPDLPDIPDTPDTPDQPEIPDNPDNPEGSGVQTGDHGKLALYGALTVLFAAGLATVLCLGRHSKQPKGGKRLRR